MRHNSMPRLAAVAVVGLAGLALAAPASASTALQAGHVQARTQSAAASATSANWDGDALTRLIEVDYANAHWNWTAWNDSTPVAFGSGQPDYQCAEFVARSMAAAGLIPGLGPNAPQSDYFDYTAPNGKTYDLLLITPLPQYNTIYDYLLDSGLATNVGDDPADAQPGDMVVTYLGFDGEASHMGLIATAQTATSEPTLDAHNNARLDYGYHYYEPAELVKLVPNAFLEVWIWAFEQWAQNGLPQQNEPNQQTLQAQVNASVPQGQPTTLPQYADPSGPQV